MVSVITKTFRSYALGFFSPLSSPLPLEPPTSHTVRAACTHATRLSARATRFSAIRAASLRAQDTCALPPSLQALAIVLHRDDEENEALREEAPAQQASASAAVKGSLGARDVRWCVRWNE